MQNHIRSRNELHDLLISSHALLQKPRARLAVSQALLVLTLLLGVWAWLPANAGPLGTAFTYSGRLIYQNQPANGTFDLQVKLFDALTAGTQVGPILSLSGLSMDNGVFVTTMDFGSGVFGGSAYWLEIAARPGGNGPFTILSPRQPVNPAPYALYTPNAGTASTASAAAANSVSTASVQNNAITASKIAPGQVVTSLNGLTDNVSLQAGANLVITPNGNVLTLDAAGTSGWSLTGNAGLTPGVNFVGTTDAEPLEFKVHNIRALRLEPISSLFSYNSINIIGGYAANAVLNGAIGVTIAGGGFTNPSILNGDAPNQVSADFGTIGGGAFNTVGGPYGTVAGGFGNQANGNGSFAIGQLASANHDGSFVWGDGTASVGSSGPNRFEVFASGGLTLTSPRGISLNAADRPLITRGWDPFNSNAGDKSGLGRWGLFMEFTQLVLGMPDTDVPNGERSIALGRYHADGSYDALMSIRNTDGRANFAGDFLTINGAGGEQAYIGGDGVGADVQIGSLNSGIQNVSFWNATQGQYMNLYAATLTLFGGADLAEPFPISITGEEIPKGTVVIIDDENPGHLKVSERSYDQRVAGVLSGAGGVTPGVRLQQSGVLEGGQNVALTGRVYVRADAGQGAIRPGDLLTTSDTPGHAMKVRDHSRAQGAILGKAMTGLTEGKGLVLVLVTLQ
jgi:hypothetical protein